MSAKLVTTSGSVCSWDTGPMPRSLVYERLESVNLEQYAPELRTDAAALRIALGEFASLAKKAAGRQRDLTNGQGEQAKLDFSVQPHRQQKEHGFELVKVNRGETENDYVASFSARVQDGRVSIVKGFCDGLYVLQTQYEQAKATVGGDAVGRALVEIMAHLKGTTLREVGGVYWIPEESVPTWQRVIEAFDNTGCKTRLYCARTVMDEQMARWVKDAIVSEITASATALTEEIAEGTLGEQALETRKVKAQALRGRVAEYESILSEMLPHLHAVVQVAETAASSALAVQQDSEAFAGMYG